MGKKNVRSSCERRGRCQGHRAAPARGFLAGQQPQQHLSISERWQCWRRCPSERQHHDNRERRASDQRAEGVAQVLGQDRHDSSAWQQHANTSVWQAPQNRHSRGFAPCIQWPVPDRDEAVRLVVIVYERPSAIARPQTSWPSRRRLQTPSSLRKIPVHARPRARAAFDVSSPGARVRAVLCTISGPSSASARPPPRPSCGWPAGAQRRCAEASSSQQPVEHGGSRDRGRLAVSWSPNAPHSQHVDELATATTDRSVLH